MLGEIDRVVSDTARSRHERYVQIYKVMQRRDLEIARLFNDPKRSKALTMIANMAPRD